VKDAQKVSDDAAQVGAAQQAEMNAITAAASQLELKDASNIDAIRKEGQTALYNARNDASIAAYEARPGRFQNTVAVNTAYNRMEKLAPRLGSSALDDVAIGAAAAERYADQIHTLLIQGLGPKHIIVSFIDQHVWAYENGNVVMDTPVTTGIRGVTAYGTDFGPMKILERYHPYKFKSPWPKGSPYWYPDTVVQWTAFFTSSGEAFHDAYWQPDSTLGPGSQFQSWTRSHGCIHMPYSLAQWMYNWADIGTPVDVYPGDGSPVADQLGQMTTDDQGNPLNPA
jgi:lipoprotein-anchoring transpeptidase ErfK/SrfK